MNHGLWGTEDADVASPSQLQAHARAWTWRPGEPPEPENTGPAMPEARRLAQGRALATRDGSRWYHPQGRRGAAPGIPALVCVKLPLILVALQTASGPLTAQHNLGLARLVQAGQACPIWRPTDRPRRTARLRGDHPWPT